MSQFSAFLDNTFSNQNKKRCSVSHQAFSEEKKKRCCIFRQNFFICTTTCNCYQETLNIQIQSINLFQCHYFFSQLGQPAKVTKIQRYFFMWFIITKVSHSKQEEKHRTQFNFFTLKCDGEFFCPNLWPPIHGADTEVTLQSRQTGSIFTLPFFHANISVSPILFCKASFNHARPQQTKPQQFRAPAIPLNSMSGSSTQ